MNGAGLRDPRSFALQWALVLLWLGFAFVGLRQAHNPQRTVDFGVYRLAAERFVHAESLYQAADAHMPFKYPPMAAALFAPVLALDRTAGAKVFNALSMLALGWVLWRLGREGVPPGALGLAVLAVAHPLFKELFYGQVDLLVLALVTWVFLEGRARPVLAGLACALSVLLKVPAALVVVPLMAHRRWSTLGASGAWLLVSTLPLVARYGLDGAQVQFTQWLELLGSTTLPWYQGYNSQGLTPILAAPLEGLGLSAQSVLLFAEGAALITVSMLTWRASRGAPLQTLAVTAACAALGSPLAWRANFVLTLPLAALLAVTPGWRSKLLLGALIFVGALTAEPLWSQPNLEAVLSLRPFAIATLAALMGVLVNPRSPEPR